MTVYGSSRDQDPGPDEPRRQPPADQPPPRPRDQRPYGEPYDDSQDRYPQSPDRYSPDPARDQYRPQDPRPAGPRGQASPPQGYGRATPPSPQPQGRATPPQPYGQAHPQPQPYGRATPPQSYGQGAPPQNQTGPFQAGPMPTGAMPTGAMREQQPGNRSGNVYGGGALVEDPYGEVPRRPARVPPPEELPPGNQKTGGSQGRRTAILVGVIAVLVIGAGTAFAATRLGGSGGGGGGAAQGGTVKSSASAASGGSPTAAHNGAIPGPAGGITLSAVGDTVMGMAPNGLPPNSGKGFFDPVKDLLTADLQMGNLEQTLTDDTGVGKCSAASEGKTCFAFRTPPGFVQNLKDAGFGVVNQANNHAYDFGPAGYTNTQNALASVGIKETGWPGAIPVVDVKGVKVAVLGFASYKWSNLCSDLDNATALIKKAKTEADLVVIQVHQGAEGATMTHVKPGTEYFLGENRCDPIAFAHNAIDAGADLVIGHGPHVMRAMEFYKGHLIAYSMGNFAGYHALTVNGVLAVGGVLKVTLLGNGTFKGATLTPTHMIAPGWPRPDPKKQAIALVGGLSRSDFPTTGAHIASNGTITPP